MRWWLMLSAVLAEGCSHDCDLAAALKELAGDGATECGHGVLGSDVSSVDACVVTSFEKRSAFVAQYDRQGDDSNVVLGIAGDVNGRVTFLLWDSDPSGGSGADAVISGDRCVNPSVDSSSNRDPSLTHPLTCTSTISLGQTCE
jgi:hypothetical protein